ncbi:hypothetical protein KVR01_012145 [Diaporthe batatas]|uniref:uncharacterized protein n=1 Tax=Diaporthe batatas TaxID=748121 RepID=UPI001D036384|nr:uncharacterized protein KVR01_012145 [Diaporthe batatas]KAG8157873.1 hypothetical protein KVR01_012145 [Diaporthe batatas]
MEEAPTMASSFPLDRLPTELVRQVGSCLSTHDALSFCRSSKSIYPLIHPLLFHHVTIRWSPYSAVVPPNITSLLQFMLRNPSYAGYIKTLDLPRVVYRSCVAWSRDLKGGNPWHWSPEDKALARAALEDCHLPHAERWYTAVVEEANLGAIIALVLAQCTNLRHLTVDACFFPNINEYFTDVLRSAITPSLSQPEPPARPPLLPSLAHVTVTQDRNLIPHDDHEPPSAAPPEAFLLFFYLPRLATLHLGFERVSFIAWNRQPWDPYKLFRWPLATPPRAATLTSLELDNIVASGYAIEFLLQHTPGLESLVCGFSPLDMAPPLNLNDLRRGLDHVRGTLTRLAIRHDVENVKTVDPTAKTGVVHGKLGPLTSLTSLRSLEISPHLLLGEAEAGADPHTAPPLGPLLPAGLRSLVLNANFRRDVEWPAESVAALLNDFFSAAAWRTATPLLEDFFLCMHGARTTATQYWYDVRVRDEFMQMVEDQGIMCTMHTYEYANYNWGDLD